MGRIFEVRKHVMFARWNRMAKQFARIGKDITIAVRSSGTDPASNPALRRVIQNARALNMPKDKIEAAIKRASGRDAANFEEILYEGYAPHGVAVLVECATDNPTRTVASVRNLFAKNGGNLATTGSVAFQFNPKSLRFTVKSASNPMRWCPDGSVAVPRYVAGITISRLTPRIVSRPNRSWFPW
jgi:YebC/PmpR family DNA-binding regulatory protein